MTAIEKKPKTRTKTPPAPAKAKTWRGGSSAKKVAPALEQAAPAKLIAAPLDRFKPGPWNRRTAIADSDLAELAASLKAHGQIEPIVVRPCGPGGFEIISGERRWRAAGKASFASIDAVVRDVDDATAAAICYAENRDRLNLEPLETAAAIAEVVKSSGSVAAAAGLLGQKDGWIARCARVASSLIPEFAKAREKGSFALWTLEHYAEVARLEPDDQKAILEQYQRYSSVPLRDLKRDVARQINRDLSKAPWKLETYVGGLEKSPTCAECPQRSSRDGLLFETEKKVDLCLNGKCHAARLEAFTREQIAAAREKNEELVVVRGWNAPKWAESMKGTVRNHDVDVVKKDVRGAKPALVFDDDGKLKSAFVKVRPKDPGQRGNKLDAEDRLRNRRRKRLTELVAAAIGPELRGKTLEELAALVAVFGTHHRLDHPGAVWISAAESGNGHAAMKAGMRESPWKSEILAAGRSGPDSSREWSTFMLELAGALEPVLRKRLAWYSPAPGKKTPRVIEEAAELATALRLSYTAPDGARVTRPNDFLAPFRDAVELEIPFPKGWSEKERRGFSW